MRNKKKGQRGQAQQSPASRAWFAALLCLEIAALKIVAGPLRNAFRADRPRRPCHPSTTTTLAAQTTTPTPASSGFILAFLTPLPAALLLLHLHNLAVHALAASATARSSRPFRPTRAGLRPASSPFDHFLRCRCLARLFPLLLPPLLLPTAICAHLALLCA